MIPAGVQMFVALDPVDMRFGFERLSGLVRERLGYEPRSGALFVFVGKRRVTAKILFHDGTGLCVLHKKIDLGTFSLPMAAEGASHIEVDEVVLDALLDGVELSGAAPPTKKKPPPRVH